MKFISYIAGCAIASFLISGILAYPADAARSPFSNPPSSYLLLVNGQTYRQKNSNTRRAPASLTKIMTALIVMEELDMDEVVTVSRGAALETGSRIGLRRGERLKVRDLLAATLMRSANDACRALADHAAGSQKAFVAKMNARARRLHLENTRFTNACGHDNAGLYSTAHDLAILTESALRIPLFMELIARRNIRITTLNGRGSYNIKNINRLIGSYAGARGVKTGTTSNAGQCLVALAQRGDRKVLLVIMHARDRWRTAPAMLDAAFAASSTAIANSKAYHMEEEILSGIDSSEMLPAASTTDDSGSSKSQPAGTKAKSNSRSKIQPTNPTAVDATDSNHIQPTTSTAIDKSSKILPTRELR
jgi:D-alanyl-D-alanine carboxypeptidase (penicillin-binding protein 5/6)